MFSFFCRINFWIIEVLLNYLFNFIYLVIICLNFLKMSYPHSFYSATIGNYFIAPQHILIVYSFLRAVLDDELKSSQPNSIHFLF